MGNNRWTTEKVSYRGALHVPKKTFMNIDQNSQAAPVPRHCQDPQLDMGKNKNQI
jgi:hypothetical protein